MSAIFGETLILSQVNGPGVPLVVFGDEFYARYETPSGFTVVFDVELGLYCYASLVDGGFVSTGVPVDKPAPPGLRTHLKEAPTVRNGRFSLRFSALQPSPPRPPFTETFGPSNGLLSGRRFTRGRVRGLTILVEFADVTSTVTTDHVTALLNEPGYTTNGNNGSVRDFFLTVSNSLLDYTNTVVGPVRLSKSRDYYTQTSFVPEALGLAVNQLGLDLGQYDSRGEGIVDALSFMYAGITQYVGELWPHNSVREITFPGGIRTHFYILTSMGRAPVELSIGTFAHETGHLLCRFPDLYDYGERDGDFEDSAGLGRYCVMSSGNHLGQGRSPAALCGYLRDVVDWPAEVVDLSGPGDHEIHQGDYRRLYRYPTGRPNEYFIVENRSRLGLDRDLPDSGLSVLHCDTLGSNEWEEGTASRHYQAALLQADGHLDLENNRNTGDATDLFASVNGVVLSDDTIPSSRLWDGSGSGLTISDVGAAGEIMRFRAGAAAPQPEPVAGGEVAAALLIPDADPAGVQSQLTLTQLGTVTAAAVSVDIIHPWIGDLVVAVVAPSGRRVVLHDRAGRDGDDIRRTWRSGADAALAALTGEQVAGAWTLDVTDTARRDTGRLNRWGVELTYQPSTAVVEVSAQPALEIPDQDPQGIRSTVTVAADGIVRDVDVEVEISHSFVGDLRLELTAPSGASATLHDRSGGGQDDLRTRFTRATTPGLLAMQGGPAAGDWALTVRDLAARDVGSLDRWTLRLTTAGA